MIDQYEEAKKIIREASVLIGPTVLQRRLGIGYVPAARLIERLEEEGIISGYNGAKPRKLLKP